MLLDADAGESRVNKITRQAWYELGEQAGKIRRPIQAEQEQEAADKKRTECSRDRASASWEASTGC